MNNKLYRGIFNQLFTLRLLRSSQQHVNVQFLLCFYQSFQSKYHFYINPYNPLPLLRRFISLINIILLERVQ